jgi:hypothetical protein
LPTQSPRHSRPLIEAHTEPHDAPRKLERPLTQIPLHSSPFPLPTSPFLLLTSYFSLLLPS